jgi:membrane protein DedA with SNARE-associated domain
LLSSLVAWLVGLPTGTTYLAIAALAALENIFPPVPADTVVGLGAYLASRGALAWPAVFAVTWTANVASATAVYFAGRHLGRPFFQTSIGRRLLSERALASIERTYRRWGAWGIFVSRALPVWRAVVPPFAGVAHLPARHALPPIYLASALWYGTLTYVVYRAGGTLDEVLLAIDRMNRGLAVAAVGATVAAVWIVRRGLARRD